MKWKTRTSSASSIQSCRTAVSRGFCFDSQRCILCTDKVCFVVVLAVTVQTRYVLLLCWQPLYKPGMFCCTGSHCTDQVIGMFCCTDQVCFVLLAAADAYTAELGMFCCTDQVCFFVQTMCADCTVCHTQ